MNRLQQIQKFRTVLYAMWFSQTNFLISHPSSDLRTGLKLMKASNINSSQSPIKFSPPAYLILIYWLSLIRALAVWRIIILAEPKSQVTQVTF